LTSDYKVVVKELSTWWRVTYKTLIAVFRVTTLAAIIMTILCDFVLKGKGAK